MCGVHKEGPRTRLVSGGALPMLEDRSGGLSSVVIVGIFMVRFADQRQEHLSS